MTYREAVRSALRDALRGDPRVFLMGEDVGRYGEAVQFSLFGCILAPDQFDEMRREVAAILDHEDLWRVRYYEVCGECQRKTVTLGKAFTTKLKRVYIV